VDSAGLVYCWGLNDDGQLGNNSTANSSVPVAVATAGTPMAGRTIVAVSAGSGDYPNNSGSACALDSAGLVYCWGLNTLGQLGNGSTTSSLVAVAVTTAGTPMAGRTITQISASSDGTFACAVDSAGLAFCWGYNATGQLGNNSTTQVNVPVAVWLPATAPENVAAFGANGSAVVYWSALTVPVTGYTVSASPGNATCSTTTATTCTLTGLTNGTTYTVSVVATTTAGNSPAGTNTVTPWPPESISASYSHTCTIASGKAYCWGDNAYGELGNNSTTRSCPG
jgi:alpha-tubulin suppressor-like RCC1 family protein